MPGKQAHLDQAGHNSRFFKSIDVTVYPDWALTCLFYTALHHIDAALSLTSQHPDSHQTRDSAVAQSPALGEIYSEYRSLKDWSYNARYKPPFRVQPTMVGMAETMYLGRIVRLVDLILNLTSPNT